MDQYYEWLNNEYISNEDKKILKNMNEKEIKDAFYCDLEFGTAGIRGIMGLGTNRINKYTIGKVTVGLSNYLNGRQNELFIGFKRLEEIIVVEDDEYEKKDMLE